jgi:hypothetical protein
VNNAKFFELKFDVTLLLRSVLSPSPVGVSFGDVDDVAFSVVNTFVDDLVLQVFVFSHS